MLDLNFGIDLILYFGPSFWTGFGPQPHKMRVPQEIIERSMFDGLECAILEPFLDTFLGCILEGVWASWKS